MTARAVSMGNARATNKARKHDRYMTPPCAVEALLRVQTFPQSVWEPCCGSGNIVRVLRKHGYRVTASDIVEHKCDFLKCTEAKAGAIITNPPYRLASAFVRHALGLGVPYVAMLLRLNFIESAGRADILEGGKLARIYVFSNRLPPMHRDGWKGKRVNSATTAYAWFVWSSRHVGPTIVQRIRWRNGRDHVGHATMERANGGDRAARAKNRALLDMQMSGA